ncbi:MAG TPA: hypothetical protein VGL56_11090 [Fimbriimonadaceae bacterium]|jgi:hypothetical protein
MDVTATEQEAVLLRFRMQNPEAPHGAVPSPEQAETLLQEIRGRERQIEGEALAMLNRATKNSPTYSGDRSKYMQLLYLALILAVVLLLIGLGTWTLLAPLFRGR